MLCAGARSLVPADRRGLGVASNPRSRPQLSRGPDRRRQPRASLPPRISGNGCRASTGGGWMRCTLSNRRGIGRPMFRDCARRPSGDPSAARLQLARASPSHGRGRGSKSSSPTRKGAGHPEAMWMGCGPGTFSGGLPGGTGRRAPPVGWGTHRLPGRAGGCPTPHWAPLYLKPEASHSNVLAAVQKQSSRRYCCAAHDIRRLNSVVSQPTLQFARAARGCYPDSWRPRITLSQRPV